MWNVVTCTLSELKKHAWTEIILTATLLLNYISVDVALMCNVFCVDSCPFRSVVEVLTHNTKTVSAVE